jgi:hypothetical protein
VEVDNTSMGGVLRSRKWHILAMLLGPPTVSFEAFRWDSMRRALADHYGCEVRRGVSREACQAVQQRLVSSLSADEMADLSRRPAAALIRPDLLGAALNMLSTSSARHLLR